jgi:asparagine synthase (glutamine-hydrolysing)
MCGIAVAVGPGWTRRQLETMVAVQFHRGPDGSGVHVDPDHPVGLGHRRLSILDLSDAGLNPMSGADGQLWIVLNGEIYNYLELRRELAGYPFRSETDTEVVLAAYERWGEDCLDRLIGMFAFAIWDRRHAKLFAARDRFGVKPLYRYATPEGGLLLASEIKALHAAGAPREPEERTWATFLANGLHEHEEATFWRGIERVGAGCTLTWEGGQVRTRRWYDLAARSGPELDRRPDSQVFAEYRALLADSVRLRFRSDVPVGVNLSGGLDSSLLLGLIRQVCGADANIETFTFATGDPRYDELPWVHRLLESTNYRSNVEELRADEVPALAASVQAAEDEPYGGLPTLAYARLFERARARGVYVLLDGQGMDEQWAGYDYYARALGAGRPDMTGASIVQGSQDSPLRPGCLTPEFKELARSVGSAAPAFPDQLRNLQLRDTVMTKLPRALRYNDRISMRASTELREPFLDHRLFELALRQPPERKIRDGAHKWLLRALVTDLLPASVLDAPKRPVQTPQREWLRGPLREWATALIEHALARPGWFHAPEVRRQWGEFLAGRADNSFFVWQWISIPMVLGN